MSGSCIAFGFGCSPTSDVLHFGHADAVLAVSPLNTVEQFGQISRYSLTGFCPFVFGLAYVTTYLSPLKYIVLPGANSDRAITLSRVISSSDSLSARTVFVLGKP